MGLKKDTSKSAANSRFKSLMPGEPKPETRVEVSTRVDEPITAKRGQIMSAARSELEVWDGNPRSFRSEEDLYDTGKSLTDIGQINPLIVRMHPDPEKAALGIKQVIAGVTRFLGGEAPYGDFPIYNVDLRALTDLEALDLAWAENAKRKDMPALDNSFYFLKRMQATGGGEDSLRKIAKAASVNNPDKKWSYERVGQFLRILTLPGLITAPDGSVSIEPDSLLDKFRKLDLNERHGRALLMLKDFPELQTSLIAEIERANLSGRAAMVKASKVLDDETNEEKKAEKATKKAERDAKKLADQAGGAEAGQGTGSTGSGNADDGDFTEGDKALGSRDHETPAQNAGTGGVGASAPAGSGSGFATADSSGQNTRGANWKADPVADVLIPVAEKANEAIQNMQSSIPYSAKQLREIKEVERDLRLAADKLSTLIQSSEILNERKGKD